MNQDYSKQTGEAYVPQECEHFGFNEVGGLKYVDGKWIDHCQDYRDEKECLMYDPPVGWRYGFPKLYKPLPGETLEQTLRRDGYPQKEIDWGGAKHVRFWWG